METLNLGGLAIEDLSKLHPQLTDPQLDNLMETSAGHPLAASLINPGKKDGESQQLGEFIENQISPGGRFTEDVVEERSRAIEALLLEDLELLERHLGTELPDRREQIKGAYAEIRKKTRENITFLRGRL